jgi:hypothetical protein
VSYGALGRTQRVIGGSWAARCTSVHRSLPNTFR